MAKEVKTKNIPHSSHDMEEWSSTIVTILETSRFGVFRKCKNCDGEQAVTAAGEGIHDELKYPCEGIE